MDAISGDASKLTLEDNNGNRIQLISNIQKQVRSVIDNLVSQCDTLTAKNEIIATLERVCHDLDSIKDSFKEEGNVSCDHVILLSFFFSSVTLKSPRNNVSNTKVQFYRSFAFLMREQLCRTWLKEKRKSPRKIP